MKTLYKRTFIRDLSSLPEQVKEKIQAIVFNEIPNMQDISQISGLKKIRGHKRYYRIKIGDYRIGIEIRENTIVFMRVLHRKDIYRYFP
ncbi:MAG TPA: type II toxin-antitoxin system RelE/ParE family toxin [Syntrophorhabdaceae bacterium]|nr:type II toxin-antitoxin system RelE/ParE family toxin [Syntrophorhabdaceae bacterium]HOL06586.1 type II toxin-antitoxin system RelE/ParE family toxin [Syntrophorhabdaceae bacterium]HQK47394.1 type II toxin-antitoxin system RelE/ParE family toxin [Syntrophorhabdaceae bacterium]HRR72458.1 type II toxin-antitoxin system RelE/ParE family toxin [Syntrophorhabdaceae bacterium]